MKKKSDFVDPPLPSPSETRSGETRRPIERIFTIHEAILRGRHPNCRRLAEEIGVTQKTIQRDITFMQNDLGLPLAYDGVKHGYFYTRSVQDFPMMKFRVEDVVALFLARQALEPLQGTPLESVLRESFRRLSSGLQGEVSFRWSELDQAFSVRESGVVPSDVTLFEKISRAMLECCELRFAYRKIDGDDWEERLVRPFHIAQCDGGWYVIGHDPHRKASRTFAMQRMKAARVMKTRFLRPADFSPDEHLGGSFGVWHNPGGSGSRHRIRLRFYDWAARIVSERRWHPSQQVKWLGEKGDTLEIILDLNGFEEILRWILSWGHLAEVMEPVELRERVLSSLAQSQAHYARGE